MTLHQLTLSEEIVNGLLIVNMHHCPKLPSFFVACDTLKSDLQIFFLCFFVPLDPRKHSVAKNAHTYFKVVAIIYIDGVNYRTC